MTQLGSGYKVLGSRYNTSIFVIYFFRVSYSMKLAVFLASGGAYMKPKIQDHLGRSEWLVGVASGHDYPEIRG
jgi:hypothetical protein